jgi:4-aminobutyrate aminotransferase-like enzyme
MLFRTARKSLVPSLVPRSRLPQSTSSRPGVVNWSEFGQQHVAHGLSGRLSNAVIESGKGSYITLSDKRGEYLDFTSGIGVTALGASHFN